MESTTNPGDVLAGSGRQGHSGDIGLTAHENEGRFAGLHSVGPFFGAAQPGWLPVLPGLWQLGGGCGIGSFLSQLLPPATEPLSTLDLADILPILVLTQNVPVAIGSLRFDLVPD